MSRRVVVMVDGVERAVLPARRVGERVGACAWCGYGLGGLPVENGEVRCPECGRHSAAAMLGIKDGEAVVPGDGWVGGG